MRATLDVLIEKLKFIRTEINCGLIDSLRIEAYGGFLTIKEAGFSNKLNSQIQILLNDPSLQGKIIEVIQHSGFNAYSSGKQIVVVSCQKIFSEEKRNIEKQIKILAEEARISIRVIRAKQRKLDKEDKNIQIQTDYYIKQIDTLSKNKIDNL